ncbi:phosphatase PAP2 family protein [Spirosoma sp. KUDC1026]|uniref:phosphatase PAP2 family protein n=1 Tax=Spirosoma sp. KUDC1026 TaxID=2745947 RepID=UPI00159BC70B|nr:phosphatase PAP2 family protein [Spirosoma sp. KUDC1026]QKZ14977.1 phosphatase PAP2 family protein [Spirosoma sp. KUDC1026]
MRQLPTLRFSLRFLGLFVLSGQMIGSALAQDSTATVLSTDSLIVKKSIFQRGIIGRIATDGVNVFSTIGRTYAQPVHWQKRDFLRLGGTLAISASALLVEKQLFSFMERNHTPALDRLQEVGFTLGRPQLNYPIMLALWGSGVVFNNDWLRDTGIMVIASVTTSGIIQTISKEVVGRPRPQAGEGNLLLKPFGGPSYHSFPSGHATLSTATFWILAHQVKPVPLKIVFYALPVITGASRVYVGAHWLSDVLLGTALGVACAESVIRLYPKIKANRNRSISVLPGLNSARITVRL